MTQCWARVSPVITSYNYPERDNKTNKKLLTGAGREARQWPGDSRQAVRGSRPAAHWAQALSLLLLSPASQTGRDHTIPHLLQQQPPATLSGQAGLCLEMLKFHLPQPAGMAGGRHLPSLQKRTTWKNLGSICRTRVEYHCWTLLHFQITLGALLRSSSTSDLIFLFLPCLVSWMDKLYKYWIIPFIKPSVDIYKKK